ncbi:DUF305 domain-containing protein [Ponticaulis sp.]|uniref:DUF305 domain-containing protein n=1 Tax=Ponticaulis sp. TaxID=2020902 RepID=UPI0026300EB6|nr:DUF305 domain-containing protein [Ponticaulis sp.]MDF1679226.1 DUF305 domain-containing protein [Ponticaulis sp.]
MSSVAQRYVRFFIMIAVSMVVMYVVMYLHTYELDHVHFSETRLFMTLLMGASMIVVMLLFMLGMYSNTGANIAIIIGAGLMFCGATWLVRSQATVGDEAYMDGMIPHHSIALLTSERADIEDLRVRELADGIIAAQKREIAEMKWLLEDIDRNGPATTQDEMNARPVPEF